MITLFPNDSADMIHLHWGRVYGHKATQANIICTVSVLIKRNIVVAFEEYEKEALLSYEADRDPWTIWIHSN